MNIKPIYTLMSNNMNLNNKKLNQRRERDERILVRPTLNY